MENANTQQANTNNDDFFAGLDLDNMSFSALDKGLGFHHKEEKLKETNKSNTYELKNTKLRTNKDIKEISVPTLKTDKPMGVAEVSINDAYGLGEINETNNRREFESAIQEDPAIIESSLEKVTAAWAVDLILIFLSIVAALILFTSATGISFNEFESFMFRSEAQVFVGIFFTIFYLLYFSVLDLNSSPGKLLFGTKLVSMNGKRLSVFHTFIRSVIILISIPLFLVPLIFGLHNKLSGTQSIEEKW